MEATISAPISSSGHVVVAAALLGEPLDIADVNIVLHLGTLVSILIFYAGRIWRLATVDRRVIGLLVIGTLPAAVIGILIKKKMAWLLESPLLAGSMLVVTGLILLVPRRLRETDGTYPELTWKQAVGIGFAQALALLPGISRSGTTIVAGLRAGLSRQDAAAFSFLLAIPAIGGASLLEIIDLMRGTTTLSTEAWKLALGAAIARVVGLAAISWLVRWLETGRLHLFSYWCIALGVGVVIWQLVS
ncbi:MAG: undecaprenyl-diphosphate phosphatase [Planctomycetota bacterium]